MGPLMRSPYCECDGTPGYECGACMVERQDKEAAERWAQRNPIRCICPDTVGFHTRKCNEQDWSRNEDR